jgi:uncharacterized protein (DUF1330 family)
MMDTYKNALYPKRTQALEALDRQNSPICMVNLLKFKDIAQYEDRRPTNLTGKEAYTIYMKAVEKLVEKVGGTALFYGDVKGLLIGETNQLWDAVAIAKYPSFQAMVEMNTSKEFMDISVHRTAGLAGQLLIETVQPAEFIRSNL